MNARTAFADPTPAAAPAQASPPGDERPRRYRFTYRDVWAMEAAGVLDPELKYELLEGDLVPMQSKAHRHEIVKAYLLEFFFGLKLPDVQVWAEPSIYLQDDHVPDPDILLMPKRRILQDMRGPDVHLVIEVSDSRLRFDLGRKAELYARYGVPEYWVVDARTLELHVFRGPREDGWISRVRHAPDEAVAPLAFPSLQVRLSEIVDLD